MLYEVITIAMKSVDGGADAKTPELPGIIPSIAMLLSQARNAGFVNAEPDADGYRRRVNLLYKWNGNYYGQLIMPPLLDRLGNPAVSVTDSRITLSGARVNGEERTVIIPRASDGSVLIDWPKKKYADFHSVSASDLVNYDMIERDLAENLRFMKDSGFFTYWEGRNNFV